MRQFAFIFILLVVVLAGCNPQPFDSPIPVETVVIQTPVRTQVEQNPALDPTSFPHTGSDPVKLEYPSATGMPNFAWRPPLNESPWALSPNDHFYFMRPIQVDQVNWFLADYRYGYQFPGTTSLHTGVDIVAPHGTPILAAAPGKVIWAGYGYLHGDNDPNDPYGLAVVVLHDFGHHGHDLITVYAHMSSVDAVVGQRVETGTEIGLVGDTGNTTGPHLHFEVRIANDNSYFHTLNPELWLVPPQNMGVLVGTLTTSYGAYLTGMPIKVQNLDTSFRYELFTYEATMHPDEVYRENLVLSDLPSGRYLLSFSHRGTGYQQLFEIYPGSVSYFTFTPSTGIEFKNPIMSAYQVATPQP
jgi:hypothetical protein